MNIYQLILIGLIYYCGSSFWLNGWLSVNHPFIGACLVGLVMGNTSMGAYIGAYIQLLYMSWLRMGGSGSIDSCFAGIITTAIGIACNLEIGITVVLAYLLSLLSSKVWDIRNRYNLKLMKLADESTIDEAGKINALYSQPYLFLITFTPALIVTALATLLFSHITIPEIINKYLNIFAYITPAIGVASVFKLTLKKKYLLYFALGCTSVLLKRFVPLLMEIMILLAILIMLHKKDFKNLNNLQKRDNYHSIIKNNDLDFASIKMYFFQYQSVNYERYQSMGLTHSISHILKKLFKDKELSDTYKRHARENYGIEPYFGTILMGILVSQEEDRLLGENIETDTISTTKSSLMGPLSAMGDSFNQFLSNHIYLLIGLILTLSNSCGGYGGLISAILINGIMLYEAMFFTRFGYKYGLSSIISINESGVVDVLIEIYTKLLIFIMGVVCVNFVVPTDITILNFLLGIGMSFACYYLYVHGKNVLYAFGLIAIISLLLMLI